MPRINWFFFFLSLIFIESPVCAATNFHPDDDVYDILRRLEADGIIESSLLTTLPLSRDEAVRLLREAERNSEGKSPAIEKQVNELKEKLRDDIEAERYIKPIDSIYGGYIYANEDNPAVIYNNDGDEYTDGSNFRLGFTSRAELGWFSFLANPEFRHSDDDDEVKVKEAYGVISLLGLNLEVGKESQWWGPGYHGSILLSNNAEPLTMIRLTNGHPVVLPWILRYLGPFKFAVFATKLEEDRVVPEPYLWGIKLDFKPSPYTEFGLQRTALLGGEGRSEDLKTWWKSFTGKGENDSDKEAGDQRAGLYGKLTMPFKHQPFQIYGEAAGEDESGGFPSKWAYLAGIYLPRILDLSELDFRAEYASTHVGGKPNVWYNHHIYKSGYTYKDRVIGHHMGTDSEDLFIQLTYYLPVLEGRVQVSYDREEHNLSANPKPTLDEFAVKMRLRISELTLEGAYCYGNWSDTGDLVQNGEDVSVFTFNAAYSF